MSQQEFKVITKATEGVYKEKGSKFYAFARPVQTRDEAEAVIDQLRKEHHTAVHVCCGYVAGTDAPEVRANDDGEPANSAGTPILNQIQAAQLYNTLVAVVRYYGGTKLGVPGLINAYKTAAQKALANNVYQVLKTVEVFELKTDYDRLGDVLRILDKIDAEVTNREYLQDVKLVFSAAKSDQVDVKRLFEHLQLKPPVKLKEQLK